MRKPSFIGPMHRRFRRQIRDLAAASVRLGELGFASSRGGNLSCRADDGCLLITPTGFRKKEVRPEDILVVRPDGSTWEARPGLKPSSEAPAHMHIMRSRPDVQAIIHAHPPVLTGFALAGVDILSKPIHPELVIEVGPVINLDYTEPTSEKLAHQFDSVILSANAFLMGGHGVMICSPVGIERALELLEMLETIAFSAWVAMSVGKPKTIPAAELDALERIMRTRNLTMPGASAGWSLRKLYGTN